MDLYRESVGDFSCTVPVLDQYVLAEFMNRGHFEQHLNHATRQDLKYQKALRQNLLNKYVNNY